MSSASTPLGELDQKLERVAANKRRWLSVSLDQRIQLLQQLLRGTSAESKAVVAKAMDAKGLTPDHPCYGEDWMSFASVTLSNISMLIRSYTQLRDHGAIRVPGEVGRRGDGRLEVDVFPDRIWARLLFLGFHGRVIMADGVDEDTLADTMAVQVRNPTGAGQLCFVLGAGNVASIPFMDCLYKLFVENQVAVVKMNPVNAYVGLHLERAFQPLIEAGYFDVVYGGAEQGKHGCTHAAVDTLHITGSGETHDAIVWGPREEQARRKQNGDRVNEKAITSELGNVTPILVVPGDWSDADLRTQAANIVSMVTHNGSFNCIAGKLLITARDWPLRERLLQHVRETFRSIPARPAYYPGAHDRWQRFMDAHPTAERLVPHDDLSLPWTLIPDLDPERTDDICFQTEPFCALLSEVPLPSDNAEDFLKAATRFCNDTVFGTLSSSILIHPKSRRDPQIRQALNTAIDALTYGCVVINQWAGVPYAFSCFPWGAHPGHTLESIGSGIGYVHNALMFDRADKSVLVGPFAPLPKPAWFVTHRRGAAVGRHLAAFEAAPGVGRLLPVVWNAALG